MDFLFENKTLQDCISNEYLAKLFCASKKSDCLNDNQIFSLLDKYGLFESIILYHINPKFENEAFRTKFIEKFYKSYYKSDINYQLFCVPFLYRLFTKINNSDLTAVTRFNIALKITKAIIAQDETLDKETLLTILELLQAYDNKPEFLAETLWREYNKAHESEENKKETLRFAEKTSGIKYKDYDEHSFIAYKGIKKDNTSTMTSRIIYKVGNIYTDICDKDDADNSFGLSVWDYINAKVYCSEKIIKVRIFFKDLHYISFKDGKIRTNRFEVLEEVN